MENVATKDLEGSKRQEVHRQLARLGPAVRRRYTTPKMRAELNAYIRERMAQGVSRSSLCHELRMGWMTLEKMLGKQPTATFRPALRRVRVVEVSAAVPGIPIVLRGPGGVVVEGMDVGSDVGSLAALFRAMS